ncbi:MAG: hypothetical protein FWB91_03165 [Defluviitaleaceae bacterium]|nr:hypothetical protein [Defluviitaleaceae bacterium]
MAASEGLSKLGSFFNDIAIFFTLIPMTMMGYRVVKTADGQSNMYEKMCSENQQQRQQQQQQQPKDNPYAMAMQMLASMMQQKTNPDPGLAQQVSSLQAENQKLVAYINSIAAMQQRVQNPNSLIGQSINNRANDFNQKAGETVQRTNEQTNVSPDDIKKVYVLQKNEKKVSESNMSMNDVSQLLEKGAAVLVLTPEQEKQTMQKFDEDLKNLQKPATEAKTATEPEKKEPANEEKKALTEEKTATTEEKTAPTEEKTAPTEEKKALTEEKTAPTEEKKALTEEKKALTEEKKAPTEEKKNEQLKNEAPKGPSMAEVRETKKVASDASERLKANVDKQINSVPEPSSAVRGITGASVRDKLMRQEKIPGDGNCLYHSILRAGGIGDCNRQSSTMADVTNLRKQTLDWISNPENDKAIENMLENANLNQLTALEIQGRSAEFDVLSKDDLIKKIGTTSDWNGALGDVAPQVIAQALGREVNIQGFSPGNADYYGVTLGQQKDKSTGNITIYRVGDHFEINKDVADKMNKSMYPQAFNQYQEKQKKPVTMDDMNKTYSEPNKSVLKSDAKGGPSAKPKENGMAKKADDKALQKEPPIKDALVPKGPSKSKKPKQ